MKDPKKVAQGRKNKRKGGDRERLGNEILRRLGFTVLPAKGSLGPIDTLAMKPKSQAAIQFKSNAWPPPQERAQLARALVFNGTGIFIWRMNDCHGHIEHVVVEAKEFAARGPQQRFGRYPGEMVAFTAAITMTHGQMRAENREHRRKRRK